MRPYIERTVSRSDATCEEEYAMVPKYYTAYEIEPMPTPKHSHTHNNGDIVYNNDRFSTTVTTGQSVPIYRLHSVFFA